jgi:glycine cleavage system H protein
MDYPDNLKYTREHEWARIEGDEAVIGITHHAQEELGDVVFLDLPKAGVTIVKGKPFGAVESVKAVSDLYAPLTGEVLRVNEAVTKSPELINRDPHGQGWLVVIRMADPGEVSSLLSADRYASYAAEEKGKH